MLDLQPKGGGAAGSAQSVHKHRIKGNNGTSVGLSPVLHAIRAGCTTVNFGPGITVASLDRQSPPAHCVTALRRRGADVQRMAATTGTEVATLAKALASRTWLRVAGRSRRAGRSWLLQARAGDSVVRSTPASNGASPITAKGSERYRGGH